MPSGRTPSSADDPREIPARYGPYSAVAHAAVASELREADLRARLDVDTVADLERAIDLGVGPATARMASAPLTRPG